MFNEQWLSYKKGEKSAEEIEIITLIDHLRIIWFRYVVLRCAALMKGYNMASGILAHKNV